MFCVKICKVTLNYNYQINVVEEKSAIIPSELSWSISTQSGLKWKYSGKVPAFT